MRIQLIMLVKFKVIQKVLQSFYMEKVTEASLAYLDIKYNIIHGKFQIFMAKFFRAFGEKRFFGIYFLLIVMFKINERHFFHNS